MSDTCACDPVRLARSQTQSPRLAVEDSVLNRGPDWWGSQHVKTMCAGSLVASAVVVAVALRLPELGAVGFGSDEAVYADQARALADGALIVRAHPPLWLGAAALLGPDASDVSLRGLALGAGVVTLLLTSAIAVSLPLRYPRMAAVLAAWIMALMPYHVDISRQFLLDGPAAAAVAMLVLALIRWEIAGAGKWLLAVGVATAVAVLIKESTLIVVVALLAVAVAAPTRRRTRAAVVISACAGLALLSWLLVAATVQQDDRVVAYAEWQMDRMPNLPWIFYADVVTPSIGIPVLIAAALGAGWFVRRRRGVMVVAWAAVPLLFFQLWPVKGYAYLAIVVPALAVLAAVGIVFVLGSVRGGLRGTVAVAAVVAVSAPLAMAQAAPHGSSPLPGRDGLPGVREAAEWIAAERQGTVLVDSEAVGNVVNFYADVNVQVAGHGTDDARLNPAYRTGPSKPSPRLAYLVWDRWTAAERPAQAAAVVTEARRLKARVGYVSATNDSSQGPAGPAVVVFEVSK